MKTKEHTQGGIRSSLISLFLVLALCSTGIGIAGAEPVMSIIPSTTNVNVGDNFSIFIEVDPAGYTLQKANTDLTFDSSKVSIMEVVNCGTFEFMFSGGTLGDGLIDDIMGLSNIGVASTGNLTEIRMHADNPGTFTIGLSDAGVGTATEVLTPDINNGTVTVSVDDMTVTATPSSVAVNTSTNVTFTVTSDGAEVAGATVTLTGVFNGANTTDANGEAIIEVNATSAGTINVLATKAGYMDAPATVTASDQAGPVINQILFNSAASPTVTAGANVNVSVTVSNSDGWENISTVVVDMSAFGAGSAEELAWMANDTTLAVFNKTIQVTKATAGTATANASDKAGNWSGDFTSGILTVIPAAAYQLKIFGPDSSAPKENTLYQQVAIQDQYDNNLTTANAFSFWVTMSKTAGHAEIKEPNPQWINTTSTTAGGVFDTTFKVYDSKDEETTIKVTCTGLLPDTKTLTYYGSVDHLDVSLNKTSLNANNGTDAILVTVQLKDASGVDIKSAGKTVEISQNTGADLFGGLTSNATDANGKTTFVITSTTKSGSDEIYAIATPSGATGTSGTITVTAIVNPDNSAMKPASITVMAGTAVPVNVTTKDYDNKVISGVTVTFNVTSGKGTLDGTAAGMPVTAVSGTNGLAEVTFVCNKAGDASTINATIGGVTVKDNLPTITIVQNVINQFAVSPGKSIGLKNVPGTLRPIAIQLKDVHGNNNTTAGVQILVTTDNTALGNMTNGTTYYDNDLYLTTDASGIATFTYQVNTSDEGTANLVINATAYGVTDTITVVTSGPKGIHLYFDKSIPMVGESVLATAQLTNEAGDPLAIGDKNITFTVRNPSGTLVGTNETPTLGAGAATFVITPAMVNGVPGVYTVTAKNDLHGLEDTNTTTFAGPGVELVLEANRTTLMVNQTVSLTATMKDANDLTTSSPAVEVQFLVDDVLIDTVMLNNGVASTTYTQSTQDTVTIEAFYNVTLQDSVSVEFIPESALTVDTIEVTPAGPLTMNVGGTETFDAVCKNGTTVLDIAVTWASSNTTVGTIDASGVFTADVNGTTTITATAQGVTSNAVTVAVGPEEPVLPGDINGDCTVNYVDLAMLGASYGLSVGETEYNAAADLNDDDTVNYIDLAMLGAHYGESC